jgi:hypothetical protein
MNSFLRCEKVFVIKIKDDNFEFNGVNYLLDDKSYTQNMFIAKTFKTKKDANKYKRQNEIVDCVEICNFVYTD